MLFLEQNAIFRTFLQNTRLRFFVVIFNIIIETFLQIWILYIFNERKLIKIYSNL